jgi:hypothetical protein
MSEYIDSIFIPYVWQTRSIPEEAALVTMDNFKSQITQKVFTLLNENHIHYCLIPPNNTDRLLRLDIAVNKPAKQFLRNNFDEWYTEEIIQQIQGKDVDDVELTPIDLSLPALKELGAKWIVEIAEYLSDNPQFIVNGFMKAEILQAMAMSCDDFDDVETDRDSDSDFYYNDE